MKTRSIRALPALAFALVFAAALASTLAAAEPRTVMITSDDSMQFSVARIEAAPGERITVVLSARTSLPRQEMAHNWVLLDRGSDVAKFINSAAVARDSGYIPAALRDRVLALTALAAGGETVRVTFEVPREAGEYPYVCTFPGHYWGGMKGVLVVR